MSSTALNSRDERFHGDDAQLRDPGTSRGTYIFYCDPHTTDMVGDGLRLGADLVIEGRGSWPSAPTEAGSTRTSFELVAGQTTVIRFTNADGTEHNVSIYRREQRDALFIGELFSGQDLATFTFRVFRIVFAIIPIALFVAILRYHLWDIDRLVNRAMVYGALTGVLGLLYAAGALVVGLVPGRFFDQSELVAVWILAAALLFRPIRRRLQRRSTGGSTGRSSTPSTRWRPSPRMCATRSTSMSWPRSSSPWCRTRCTRRRWRSGSATPKGPRRETMTTGGPR